MSSTGQLLQAQAVAHEACDVAKRIDITKGRDAWEITVFFRFIASRLKQAASSPSAQVLAGQEQTLAYAVSATVDTLKLAAKAVSPAGILLLSAMGPIVDSSGQVATPAVFPFLKALVPTLSGLQERAARADVLRQRLLAAPRPEPETETGAGAASGANSAVCHGSGAAGASGSAAPTAAAGPDAARAVDCVRQALCAEGMAAESVSHPQMLSEVINELYDLANETRLVNRDEAQLLTSVASALLLGGGLEASDGGGVARPPATPVAAAAATSPPSASSAPASPPRGGAAPAVLPLPQSYVCPLTLQLFRDPVITAAGHTYERSAVETWLQHNSTDPKTRTRLLSKILIPNWTVKGAIEEWLARLGLTHDQIDGLTMPNSGVGSPRRGTAAAARAGAGCAAAAAGRPAAGAGGPGTGAAANPAAAATLTAAAPARRGPQPTTAVGNGLGMPRAHPIPAGPIWRQAVGERQAMERALAASAIAPRVVLVVRAPTSGQPTCSGNDGGTTAAGAMIVPLDGLRPPSFGPPASAAPILVRPASIAEALAAAGSTAAPAGTIPVFPVGAAASLAPHFGHPASSSRSSSAGAFAVARSTAAPVGTIPVFPFGATMSSAPHFVQPASSSSRSSSAGAFAAAGPTAAPAGNMLSP
ncbi:hypothetical protein PLESTF_001623600 [Pleodorina starrii]|nr:hypothetical protein PLESTF_001623600 [Pleodorina starrii]